MSEQENQGDPINLSDMEVSIRQFMSEGKLVANGSKLSGEMFDLWLRMRESAAIDGAIKDHVERVDLLSRQTKERMKQFEATIQTQREEGARIRLENDSLRHQLLIEKQSHAGRFEAIKVQHMHELGQLRMEAMSERMQAKIQEHMLQLSKEYPGLKQNADIEPKLIDAGINIGEEVARGAVRHLFGTSGPER